MERLTKHDFAESFGVDVNSFSQELVDCINLHDFNFSRPNLGETKALILDILKKIKLTIKSWVRQKEPRFGKKAGKKT